MYWVLDGVLRCAWVRVQCACAFARVLKCLLVFICVRARVSVRVSVPVGADVRVFVPIHRIGISRVCVRRAVQVRHAV